MSAVPSASIAVLLSGLSDLYERTLSSLPPDLRQQVEDQRTSAERLAEEVFDGVPVFQLRDSDLGWVRSSDIAEVLGVGRSAISHQVSTAEERGDLRDTDVRRGVRDSDLATSSVSHPHTITSARGGVMVLSIRAVQRLAMLGNGERGVRFRDGLERLMERAHLLERTLLASVVAERNAVPNLSRDVAANLITTMLVAERKRIPRWLWCAAQGVPVPDRSRQARPTNRPQLTGPVPQGLQPREPHFPDGYPTKVSTAADAVGVTVAKLRRQLEDSGMWDDPEWVLHGVGLVVVGNHHREEQRHRLRNGWLAELQRRVGPLFQR